MKTKLIVPLLFAIPILTVLTASTNDTGIVRHSNHNKAGTSTSTGSPGETHTCSQAGCHGAGNGSGTTGGLVDNAGPGSLQINSVPAISGGLYVPGTTYHMSIVVSEAGKQIFGFNFEALDNSGSTDLHINNTAGSYTITDATHTHIMQGFGTGRMTVCHMLNGGLSANSATFIFDWIAPASGTVNFYCTATACNNDGLPDSQDNVYSKYLLGLNPSTATGINESIEMKESVQVYPNPASGNIQLAFNLNEDQLTLIQLYSLDGKLIRTLEQRTLPAGRYNQTYNLTGVDNGIYLLRTIRAGLVSTNKIIIR